MNQKQTILITGPTSGIGYELAKLAARDGGSLILVSRDEAKLKSVAEELKSSCLIIPADLAHPAGAQKVIDEVQSRNIQLDVLVNNAGFGTLGEFAESNITTELEMIQVNIASLMMLTRTFLPGMVERRTGGVLNVASTAAFQGGPFMATYYASKAFVVSFTDALAHEVAQQGVRISALCPGPTSTNFQKRAGVQYSKLFSNKGMMKVMTAADVARIGWEGFGKGKRLIVPGFRNKIGVFGTRLVPRRTASRIAGLINRNKTGEE